MNTVVHRSNTNETAHKIITVFRYFDGELCFLVLSNVSALPYSNDCIVILTFCGTYCLMSKSNWSILVIDQKQTKGLFAA